MVEGLSLLIIKSLRLSCFEVPKGGRMKRLLLLILIMIISACGENETSISSTESTNRNVDTELNGVWMEDDTLYHRYRIIEFNNGDCTINFYDTDDAAINAGTIRTGYFLSEIALANYGTEDSILILDYTDGYNRTYSNEDFAHRLRDDNHYTNQIEELSGSYTVTDSKLILGGEFGFTKTSLKVEHDDTFLD